MRQSPGGPPIRPYDVAGWTLPMQMGVEVAAVLQPVSEARRAGLHSIDKVSTSGGSMQGAGPTYVISHQPNASFSVLNAVLAGGGQAAFIKAEVATPEGSESGAIVLSGLDRDRMAGIAKKYSIDTLALAKAPKDELFSKKPRVGLYRSWTANIDEGWTRWILENYGFDPVQLRDGDVRAGHLRDRLDAIILPDASPARIMNGFAPGTIQGEFAGGLGEPGADALRTFVHSGGTLIAFNNASLMAIESFGLPVTNVLAGLSNEQFYCSGSLLRVELSDTTLPANWGLPPVPIVMFELGPAFDTKPDFHGTILATYSKERSPLASGYLLHPERLQGKAAALEVFYGDGRVYLFGFRPQWRGQSHGTYKFVFNAIYDSPGMAKPTSYQKPVAAASTPGLDSWRTAIAKARSDLAAILEDNRAFFAAKGPAAADANSKLNATVDQFDKERLPELQDASIGMDDTLRRKAAECLRGLRRLTADLRKKEFEQPMDVDGLLDRYKLTDLEPGKGSSRL